MSYIRTLLGDIKPDELGITDSHEHIVCRPPYWVEEGADDLLLDEESKSLADIEDFKRYGGKSMVDATAIDYGRDIEAVAGISRRTGINIIGTGGFNKGFLWSAQIPQRLKPVIGNYDTFNSWIGKETLDNLVEFVRKEVETGLEGTNFRAGQIKFGTGYNSITPLEEKTIRVISEVHKLTGAPIHSHTEAGTMAIEQIEILESENIDLRNVSFGHMDRNIDPYYFEQIASKGAFLSFDGLGKNKYGPESNRINAIMALIKMGYQNQILIGGDMARKTYYKHYGYHGLGLEWILKRWIPRFEDECNRNGLDGKAMVGKILVDNPRRYLTFKEI